MRAAWKGVACMIGGALAGMAAAQPPSQAETDPAGLAEMLEAPVQAGNLGACGRVKPRTVNGGWLGKNRRLTRNDVMQSWVGEPTPELVSRWGAPTRTYDNRDGSRILTWIDAWSGCTQTMLIDAQDIVSRWRYSDCRCVQGVDGPPKGTPVPPMTL